MHTRTDLDLNADPLLTWLFSPFFLHIKVRTSEEITVEVQCQSFRGGSSVIFNPFLVLCWPTTIVLMTPANKQTGRTDWCSVVHLMRGPSQ